MAVTAHSRRPQDRASFLPTERNEHHASQLFFSLPRTHLTAFAADVPCAVLSRDLWNERGPRTRAGRRHHRRVMSDDVIAEVEDGGARLSQARCAGGSAHLGPGRRLFRRDANAVEPPFAATAARSGGPPSRKSPGLLAEVAHGASKNVGRKSAQTQRDHLERPCDRARHSAYFLHIFARRAHHRKPHPITVVRRNRHPGRDQSRQSLTPHDYLDLLRTNAYPPLRLMRPSSRGDMARSCGCGRRYDNPC